MRIVQRSLTREGKRQLRGSVLPALTIQVWGISRVPPRSVFLHYLRMPFYRRLLYLVSALTHKSASYAANPQRRKMALLKQRGKVFNYPHCLFFFFFSFILFSLWQVCHCRRHDALGASQPIRLRFQLLMPYQISRSAHYQQHACIWVEV